MHILISVATSADGFIDDSSSERLVLSSPEDWAEVYRLRAECDAILIGAETLRRDNPSLRVKDEQLRTERAHRGLSEDPTRVVVSGSGRVDPQAKFFTKGNARQILFTNTEVSPELHNISEVIRISEPITAKHIIDELSARGIEHLMIEGGAQILRLFIASNYVNRIRLAIAPHIVVGDPTAPRLFENVEDFIAALSPHHREESQFGYMRVITLDF